MWFAYHNATVQNCARTAPLGVTRARGSREGATRAHPVPRHVVQQRRRARRGVLARGARCGLLREPSRLHRGLHHLRDRLRPVGGRDALGAVAHARRGATAFGARTRRELEPRQDEVFLNFRARTCERVSRGDKARHQSAQFARALGRAHGVVLGGALEEVRARVLWLLLEVTACTYWSSRLNTVSVRAPAIPMMSAFIECFDSDMPPARESVLRELRLSAFLTCARTVECLCASVGCEGGRGGRGGEGDARRGAAARTGGGFSRPRPRRFSRGPGETARAVRE